MIPRHLYLSRLDCSNSQYVLELHAVFKNPVPGRDPQTCPDIDIACQSNARSYIPSNHLNLHVHLKVAFNRLTGQQLPKYQIYVGSRNVSLK